MNLHRLALAAAIAATAAGCSGFGSKSTEYKGAAARTVQPLEVPPELTTPTIDDRYAIPDPRAQTTYSAYTQRAQTSPLGATASTVLPKVEGVRLERSGDQRWLVAKGDPAVIWPLVRDFWIENGYSLAREEPNTGILETDWYEDRSKIPQDLVRRTVGRVIPNIWTTSRRDKYRTRLEKGAESGTTEIFVSNRHVEEVWADANQDRTIWQSRPADRELEAEMLQRLLVKFGAAEAQAANAKAMAVAAGAAAAAPPSRNAVLETGGLVVNDTFDRAWRRVGLALDRVGFTVEDRDRSKGLFFVRYIDPERDLAPAGKPKEGFLDRLKFWKSDPSKSKQPQYRIHVSDAGASMSQVRVQDAQGAADQSNTSKKILSLLYDQLK
jgi:outer membrane protein assembly factor BamC